MGNDDVASVNARREYMGNVTVLVNQKYLSRECTVFKKMRGFFFRKSYCMCSVYKSRRAAVLKGGEKLKFLVPFALFHSRRKPT